MKAIIDMLFGTIERKVATAVVVGVAIVSFYPGISNIKVGLNENFAAGNMGRCYELYCANKNGCGDITEVGDFRVPYNATVYMKSPSDVPKKLAIWVPVNIGRVGDDGFRLAKNNQLPKTVLTNNEKVNKNISTTCANTCDSYGGENGYFGTGGKNSVLPDFICNDTGIKKNPTPTPTQKPKDNEPDWKFLPVTGGFGGGLTAARADQAAGIYAEMELAHLNSGIYVAYNDKDHSHYRNPGEPIGIVTVDTSKQCKDGVTITTDKAGNPTGYDCK